MRVVILYNTSWYVFLLRRNLIASLLRRGCEVIVVAPKDAYTARVQNLGATHVDIPLEPGSKNPLVEMKTIAAIIGTLRALQPDAVLSFTIKCNLYAGIAKYFCDFNQVANISGLGEAFEKPGTLRTLVRLLYKVALQRTNRIFFQNGDDFESFTRQRLVDKARSRVIPGSGVDLSNFAPRTHRPPGPRTFLMFGRLLPQKGFHQFVEAAARLKGEFGEKVAFWILGAADHDRPESVELLRTIERAHATGVVRYLQSCDDVRPVLQESDVVVLPSTYNEGIPRSLLEALACGKAIITTDWKGCRETVIPKTNGHLIRPHDTNSLISSMREMIQLSDNELRAHGEASRKLAQERFDERLVLKAYIDALTIAPRNNDDSDAEEYTPLSPLHAVG
jgi:glycosyltransferase involved in cell wall biosynthesis